MLRRTFLSTTLLGAAAAVAADSIDVAPWLPAWPLPHRPLAPFAQAGIWDSFYWGAWQERAPAESLGDALAAERPASVRAGIARQCIHLHVGAGTARPEFEKRIRENPDEIRAALSRHADRLLGVARLNADDVGATLAAIETWIAHGPMIGISLVDGKISGAHPNFDPIVRRAAELGAMIVQANWFDAREAGRTDVSTPATLAVLAARHPDVTFISTHAGGEWEKGIRAVRAHRNILVETSGFDSTAGFVDMAVRELGAERILFGSHFPGRSVGTELAKILSAEINDRDRELIFRGNLRRLLAPILRRKGLSVG